MAAFTEALPKIGETERAALESGTVGFEGCLFAGKADFAVLAAIPAERLDEEERVFLEEQVAELCGMLDDFAIDEAHDLPAEVWDYLRRHRFFGMIIPRAYGGLEFSHAAHAAVVTRIASVNGRGGDRDGAEFARARRIAAALRHRGSESALPATPGAQRGSAVLCVDLSLCGLGRGGDPRCRGTDAA